ncbi:hypothetical protein [uncultured Tissierella sp.]|uniref:structural cement protein Gp24 n=1 Tax=uncultured Tissierella sp. TaxID=448160 RepID=UPI002804F35C|nr:hypothetical protein [uncultured Tissierella sp.]MDU5080238.1 hypothetical protein [Bacillota bacterium]
MPGKVIQEKLNYGYPGSVSRSNDAIIINRRVKGEGIAFGSPVVMNDDNSFSAFGEGHAATNFVGVAVREVKQTADYYNSTGMYLENEPADVITRGSVTVEVNVGTPKARGKVYIRVAENSAFPNGVIGGFEAAADGVNTIELSNVVFTTGQIDANKVAEITILSRNA